MGKLQTDKKLTSLEDMFGGFNKKDVGAVTEIDVTKLIPFSKHPFKLYEGARLKTNWTCKQGKQYL